MLTPPAPPPEAPEVGRPLSQSLFQGVSLFRKIEAFRKWGYPKIISQNPWLSRLVSSHDLDPNSWSNDLDDLREKPRSVRKLIWKNDH